MKRIFWILGLFLFSPGGAHQTLAEEVNDPKALQLPALGLDPSRITVSGVSSGAFFAQQFHVIHSRLVKGSAPVAGGVFWCAQGDSKKAQSECMGNSASVKVEASLNKVRELEKQGLVDPLNYFSRGRAYIFHSDKDFIIHPGHSVHSARFYGSFMATESVKLVKHPQAAHGFPTKNFGNSCATMGPPWILNCGLDLATDLLFFLEEKDGPQSSSGVMLDFDQKEFGGKEKYLFDWGAVYVPDNCRQGGCGLHIAFHGCQMNPEFIQRKFIENGGYQDPANRKGLVVLFPQSAKGPGNPYACWDWFGFAGNDYVTKNGAQVQAVKAMVERLLMKSGGLISDEKESDRKW